MSRALILPVLIAALLGSGCVSKKELEEAQAELAACEEEKVSLQAAVLSWEMRFDREATRWSEMEASVSEAVPRALAEIHEERERIVELVPEQVQEEVSSYLDEYFATVMKGFELVQQDNRDIKLQLATTHKVIETLSKDTRDIGADTRSIGVAIDEAVAAERSQRELIALRVAELIEMINAFDDDHVDCKKCPDSLKLNRKQREPLVAFHSQLTTELSRLQTLSAE